MASLQQMDWGTVPDWIVAVTAVVGVVFGLRQLRSIRLSEAATLGEATLAREAQEAATSAHRDWVQVERAQFLMQLDDRFESEWMGEGKRVLRALRNRFEAEAERAMPNRSNAARAEEAAKLFSAHLTEIWRETRRFDSGSDPSAQNPVEDKSARGYALVMRLPYWIETVGFLVRKQLVAEEDILRLYDHVIITTVTNIRRHVEDRADEGPHPNRAFLENAVWLAERALQLRADASKAGTIRPSLTGR